MNIKLFLSRVNPVSRVAALTGVLAAPLVAVAFLVSAGCSDAGAPPSAGTNRTIASDADLFTLITETSPFTGYALFPGVDSVASGTLNGSTAHQPLVRVSINPEGLGSLVADTLPAGGSFADGSVIVKEIREAGETTLLAVLMKETDNPYAAGDWLWAEYRPDGTVVFSINRRGDGCISCHSREQGLRNDLVRTFERRHP
jgi:hypothetical protein